MGDAVDDDVAAASAVLDETLLADREQLIDYALQHPERTRLACLRWLETDLTDQERSTAAVGLAWSSYTTGDFEAARDALASPEMAAVEPPVTVRLEIAILSAEGNLQLAEQRLTATIDAHPDLNCARLLSSLGQIHFARRDFDAALGFVDRGLGQARAFADVRAEVALLVNRATAHIELGDLVTADDALQHAQELAQHLGGTSASAVATHNRGVVAARQGNYPRAIEHFDRAARALRESGGVVSLAHASLDQCDVLLEAGLFSEAHEKGLVALAIFSGLGSDRSSANAAAQLARVSAAAGNWSEALREIETALASARRASTTSDVSTIEASAQHLKATLDLLVRPEASHDIPVAASAFACGTNIWLAPTLESAMVLRRNDRVESARRLLQQCVEATATSASAELTRLTAKAVLAELNGDPVAAKKAVDEGLSHASRSGIALAVTELRAMMTRRLDQLIEVAAGVDDEPDRLLERLELARSIALFPEPEISAADRQTLAQLRTVNKLLGEVTHPDPALLAERSQLELALQSSRRIEQAQNHQLPNRALDPALPTVDLYAVGGQVHVIYDNHAAGLVTEPVASLADLRRFLRTLRLLLGRRAVGVELPIEPTLERVRELLAPALRAIEANSRCLVIIDPSLEPVPWTLLTDTIVVQSPSLALARGSARATGESGPLVLVAGPNLHHGDAEVDAIARRFPDARILAGPDATSGNVIDAFGEASHVHFAVHGRFRRDRPLHSSVELADGQLTFFELLTDRAPSRLVFSSCDVGQGASSAVGLAALLLSRGTRELVASFGPSNDRSTFRLMDQTYEKLAVGESLAGALAHAQFDLRTVDPSVGLFTSFGS